MWGIVEKVIDDKVYVIFSDRKRAVYVNNTNFDIFENNEVEIIDNCIVNIKQYNKELYKKIKELENKIKNNNCN